MINKFISRELPKGTVVKIRSNRSVRNEYGSSVFGLSCDRVLSIRSVAMMSDDGKHYFYNLSDGGLAWDSEIAEVYDFESYDPWDEVNILGLLRYEDFNEVPF